MNKEDPFSRELHEVYGKLGKVLEKALRKYVHYMVRSSNVLDRNIIGRTQGIVNEMMCSPKNRKYLYNRNEFFVKADNKDTELCTIIGTGAIYANETNMSRFTDGELAFIVGHELGHMALRHFECETNMERVCKNEPDLLLAYKRVQEHECDMFGVYFAQSVGADFSECMSAIRKLDRENTSVLDNYRYWEDHPTAAERSAFLRKNYSKLNVDELWKHTLSHELREIDTTSIVDVMGVTKEMRKQAEMVRKDNVHMFATIGMAKEKLKENPEKYALQYYLDTRNALNHLSDMKKDTFMMRYYGKEINDAVKIANAILKLPEIQKVKSKGLIKSTITATFEHKNKGHHR